MTGDTDGPSQGDARLGALLKWARGDRSQEAVARDSGLSVKALYELERGVTHGRARTVAQVALTLRLTPDVLAGLREDAARELERLILERTSRLDREDLALVVALRARRRRFPTQQAWEDWLHEAAPDLFGRVCPK